MPLTTSKTARTSRVPPDFINNLGDDLLIQILTRLPDPRSAGRYRTVCKRWSTLIFSPRFNRPFVSFHRSRSQPPPLHLPQFNCNLSILVTFLPVPHGIDGYFHVCDSFKDLVLCNFVEKDDGPNKGELGRTLFICNVFSKQWVALPLAPRRTEGCFHKEARLVCKPTESIELDNDDCGGDGGKPFVYSEYRFRVVRMYLFKKSINLDVFCSEDGEWTSKVFVVDDYINRFKDPDPSVISWEGRLFWVKLGGGGRSTSLLIVDFNPFCLDRPPKIIEASSSRRACRLNFSVSWWPTPIPKYKELRHMYDGTYDCWDQRGGRV